MPPIAAAHLDLRNSLDAFLALIRSRHHEKGRAAREARTAYLKAGGSALHPNHPAVVAYQRADEEFVQWSQIVAECDKIEAPSLRNLGLEGVM